MARDELVTIEGVVGDAERAVFVDAAIEREDGELLVEHRSEFALVVDGRSITIEPAKNPIVRPDRKLSGAWRTLREHATRPSGDFHPDGHVTMRGVWIEPGERICVIGYAKEHAFVPDTGGHREAPERQLARVRAIAIGVGDDAAEHAQKALAQRERELGMRSRPKPGPSTTRWAYAAIACFAVAVLLVIAQQGAGTPLAGFALVAAIFGLLCGWCAVPTRQFPGGALDKQELTGPGILTRFVAMLLLPLVLVLALLGDGAAQRSALAPAGWLLLGLFPLQYVLRGVIAKPRAEPGPQVELPVHPALRWVLVVGLVATWIATLLLAIPHLKNE